MPSASDRCEKVNEPNERLVHEQVERLSFFFLFFNDVLTRFSGRCDCQFDLAFSLPFQAIPSPCHSVLFEFSTFFRLALPVHAPLFLF